MAFKKELYDENWKDVIRPEALKRAQYKCQNCGVSQRSQFYREKGQRVIIEDSFILSWAITNKKKISTVHLAISHTDHNTSNNNPDNLKALCQECHLRHDKEFHKATRIGKRKHLPRGLDGFFSEVS